MEKIDQLWVFSPEELAATKNRADGMSELEEKEIFLTNSLFIEKVINKYNEIPNMNLSSVVSCVATSYMQRFFISKSLRDHSQIEQMAVCLACIIDASKVFDAYCDPLLLLKCVDGGPKVETVYHYEFVLLDLLGYHFSVTLPHPYLPVEVFPEVNSGRVGTNGKSDSVNRLFPRTFQLISRSFRTTLPLRFRAPILALGCLRFAALMDGDESCLTLDTFRHPPALDVLFKKERYDELYVPEIEDDMIAICYDLAWMFKQTGTYCSKYFRQKCKTIEPLLKPLLESIDPSRNPCTVPIKEMEAGSVIGKIIEMEKEEAKAIRQNMKRPKSPPPVFRGPTASNTKKLLPPPFRRNNEPPMKRTRV
eukprot:TRINITY_DN9177_c0_g2_i1.p1 TRINITY_DN9177_c0_g2~~TRINITY_DN9177_c0_g2_i1.p1  ORF type:complete len:364 (+),score=57.63 TRINITY_DN9177_c0_g2_i1:68-1159(+)